jgi:hypothetical protein
MAGLAGKILGAPLRRLLIGFVIGIAVCVAYWMFGFIPRETWFTSQWTHVLIIGQTWLWPTAALGDMFRNTNTLIAMLATYSMNGAMYALVSWTLLVSRERVVLYAAASLTTLAAVTWFNAAVMDLFSWFWFIAIAALLLVLGVCDLRNHRSR